MGEVQVDDVAASRRTTTHQRATWLRVEDTVAARIDDIIIDDVTTDSRSTTSSAGHAHDLVIDHDGRATLSPP